LAAAQVNDTQAMKERFVKAHLADAQKAADELGVPVENILGLSALESGWGNEVSGRFAKEGNNFFSIHYPAPFATGYMLTEDGEVMVAKFDSYADCLKSFVKQFGGLVRGKSDPDEFSKILQDAGKFGITRKGNKEPNFVPDTARTIRLLRPVIERVSRKA
jgi:flagellum-specific peptidoglycan hydrolase FlgJ